MSKTFKLTISSLLVGAILAVAGLGIFYEAKWIAFKKDFAKEIVLINKGGFPDENIGIANFKRTSTKHHDVVYKFVVSNIGGIEIGTQISEQYHFNSKFNTDTRNLKFKIGVL